MDDPEEENVPRCSSVPTVLAKVPWDGNRLCLSRFLRMPSPERPCSLASTGSSSSGWTGPGSFVRNPRCSIRMCPSELTPSTTTVFLRENRLKGIAQRKSIEVNRLARNYGEKGWSIDALTQGLWMTVSRSGRRVYRVRQLLRDVASAFCLCDTRQIPRIKKPLARKYCTKDSRELSNAAWLTSCLGKAIPTN